MGTGIKAVGTWVAPGNQRGWWHSLAQQFRDHGATFVVTSLLAILTVFSDRIAGQVKFALNRADQRIEKYHAFAPSWSFL